MIKNKKRIIVAIFFLFNISLCFSQDIEGYSKQEIKAFTQQVEDQIKFLEYFLNTLGSTETPARDKDVIIRQSYLKIFRDGKVQVEDDLLLDRKVVTNKDIPSYLKDIEFFYKEASFQFKVREIKPFLRDNGELSFIASLDRTITAIGLNKEKISNTKPRFIEVNVDKKSNELKIASIYTTKLSREKELLDWWNSLSPAWIAYFKAKFLIKTDSVSLDQLYRISSLDSINISGNKSIKSLAPIEALRDLKFLDISNTRITELNPISNITFLTYLNIANTPTKQIQFIKYSDRLKILDISGTQIKDISELGNLKSLESLQAVKTPISSFDVINSFSSLKSLNISESGFNNIENIHNLNQLTHLDISKNYLINFDLLSNLENIEVLNLQGSNIVNLNPLSNLKRLKILNINQTEVSDLSPLEKSNSIEKIYADRTVISENTANMFSRNKKNVLLIHNVENLQTWWIDLSPEWKDVLSLINPKLKIARPSIEDLTFLVSMDSLVLSNSAIDHLGPVLKFRKVNHLAFDNTKVQDLSPLADINTLLSISGNFSQVNTLDPLSNLNSLQRISFKNTSVSSLNILKELPSIKYINVDNSRVTEAGLPEFFKKNQSVQIVFRTTKLNLWWESLSDEWRDLLMKENNYSLEIDPTSELLHSWSSKSEFNIEKSRISNFSPLLVFFNLRKLHIHDVAAMDMSDLGQLTLLEDLRLSQAPINDLSSLAPLSLLSRLNLSNTGIEDLKPLSKLQKIEYLNISGTNIKSLKGLEVLSNLIELDVASTNVRSLTPVQGLPELKRLICFNTKINQRSVDGFKKLNPNTDVRFY
jgi:Leucine-rich repeat (LRR) protein